MKKYLFTNESANAFIDIKKWYRKLVFLFISCLCLLSSYSQPSRCDGVLIPDVKIINNEYAYAKAIVNIFQSNHIETYNDYKNYMDKATIPIEGLPWTSESSITAQNFKEKKDDLYTYNSLSEEEKLKINETIKSLSTASIEAWTACQNQKGFRIWLLQGENAKEFTLAAIYNGVNSVHLRNVSFSQKVITTNKKGTFTNLKLKTNTSYPYQNTTQYQTFTRTTNDPITIDVSTYEPNSGEGLHVQLGAIPNSKPQPPPTGIVIADGDINENSLVNSNSVGTGSIDPNGVRRNSWRNMPWAGSDGPYDGSASVSTKPTVKILVAEKYSYQWNLDIVNVINTYCRGGQDPTGGKGQAAPQYRTIITLPQLTSSKSFWTVTLRANTDVDIDNDNSLGSTVSVTLTINGLPKTISFAVNRKHEFKILKIDSLKPGNYILELQAPLMLTTCLGAPSVEHKASYTTSLSVDISANQSTEDPKPKSYTVYYWVVGILLLLVGLFYSYSKKNKRIG